MDIRNEVNLYKIDKQNIEQCISIPIDVRMIRMESLAIDIFKIYTETDAGSLQNKSKLFFSFPLIKQYIRMMVANESKHKYLFTTTHPKLTDFCTSSPICFNRYDYSYRENVGSLPENASKVNRAYQHYTIKEMHYTYNLLKDIYTYIKSVTESSGILKDNVLVFSIDSDNINIYSLGNICAYRFNEVDYPIFKISTEDLNNDSIYSPAYLPVDVNKIHRVCIDPY